MLLSIYLQLVESSVIKLDLNLYQRSLQHHVLGYYTINAGSFLRLIPTLFKTSTLLLNLLQFLFFDLQYLVPCRRLLSFCFRFGYNSILDASASNSTVFSVGSINLFIAFFCLNVGMRYHLKYCV
jgi:hypothetical protein